jgi:hypothetical protein
VDPDLDTCLPDPLVHTRHRRSAETDPNRLWHAAESVRLRDAPTLGRAVRWRIPGTASDLPFRDLLRQYPFAVVAEETRWSISGMWGPSNRERRFPCKAPLLVQSGYSCVPAAESSAFAIGGLSGEAAPTSPLRPLREAVRGTVRTPALVPRRASSSRLTPDDLAHVTEPVLRYTCAAWQRSPCAAGRACRWRFR